MGAWEIGKLRHNYIHIPTLHPPGIQHFHLKRIYIPDAIKTFCCKKISNLRILHFITVVVSQLPCNKYHIQDYKPGLSATHGTFDESEVSKLIT
jgi:hypothetical protein